MPKKKEQTEIVAGIKGFDPNLKCRGYQYEIGKEYEEKDARACETGFHFCENPMDVFAYYPPSGSRYAEVDGTGEIDRHNDDSKIACTKLRIKCEIGLSGLINAGVKFILDKVKWKESKESNTGNYSAATNTGDQSAATNTGYQSAATNTGDQSAATNTGNQSAATVEGKQSVACALGVGGKAKGKLTCWITLAEWECVNGEWRIKCVKSAPVDGEKIKEDTFYILKDDEFVEA